MEYPTHPGETVDAGETALSCPECDIRQSVSFKAEMYHSGEIIRFPDDDCMACGYEFSQPTTTFETPE